MLVMIMNGNTGLLILVLSYMQAKGGTWDL